MSIQMRNRHCGVDDFHGPHEFYGDNSAFRFNCPGSADWVDIIMSLDDATERMAALPSARAVVRREEHDLRQQLDVVTADRDYLRRLVDSLDAVVHTARELTTFLAHTVHDGVDAEDDPDAYLALNTEIALRLTALENALTAFDTESHTAQPATLDVNITTE